MPDSPGNDTEVALRNVAALARFADPRRLPPYPRHRRAVLLWAAWRGMRVPAQRPWPEP